MVSVNKGVLAAVAMAAAGFSATASAQTATAQFAVKITIQKACTVTAGVGAADIDFGTVSAFAGDQNANNSASPIVVRCSKTTPYTLGLLPSNSAVTGAGVMTGTGGTIAYQLRSTTGLAGTPWGNNAANGWLSGSGNGANQNYTAYATVLSAALNMAPGTYTDTVTVTVTY